MSNYVKAMGVDNDPICKIKERKTMRDKRITYAIDLDTGLVVSRMGSEYAWPILDFEGMKPENNFQTVYNLEKIPVNGYHSNLLHTRKISLEVKNCHRAFWGMVPIKETGKYCPVCGEYWKKDKCQKVVKRDLA